MFVVIAFHQVNCAVTLDHTKNQWIDLGVHTEACMTRPETCGAAGGTISLWVKQIECPAVCKLVTSQLNSGFSTYSEIIYVGHNNLM